MYVTVLGGVYKKCLGGVDNDQQRETWKEHKLNNKANLEDMCRKNHIYQYLLEKFLNIIW